jgi:tetratricopeptide (TPR) repeat protein
MKKNIIWFIVLVLSLSNHLSAQSKRQRNPLSDMYKDPYWQKRFVGDLAFLEDREPGITLEEKELLDEIKNLLPNRIGEAIELLEESITNTSSAALDFIIGQLNLQIGNLQQAKVHMAEAARKYPNYLRAQRTLGMINVRLEDYDQAVKHLTKSISLGDTEGRTYGLLGYCFQAQGIPIAAEKAYGFAVITEPDNDDWKNGLARNLLDQDKFLESHVQFEKLILKDPSNADNWVLQANSLIGLNRIDEAAANIELITRMGLAQADSMHLLGDIYLLKNMYESARKAYLAS